MRVGINALFLIPGEVGGSETYLRGVLDAMVAHHPRIELVLFTNRDCHEEFRAAFPAVPNVECRLLRFTARNRYMRIVREQTELPWRVCAARVDVLWSPGYTAPVWSRCPQVVSILDMQYKRHPEDLTPLARLTTDLLVRAAARRSRTVTTISEFSKREILRYLPVSADRVHVTPLAASEVFGTPLGTQDLKSRLRRLLPGVGDFFLCVANTYPHKQLHIIVEAMARLPEPMRYPLVLVGKPRLGEPAFQSALDRTRLRGGLIRLPRVSPEDLRAIYQGTALFLFPSVYEGFGLPVLEAMASGAVVVTTREGAIPEVAGGTVRYFEAGQASDLAKQIEEALSWSPGRREAWAASARARAAGFTWRRTADLTVAAFEAALGMPAKKPADHG